MCILAMNAGFATLNRWTAFVGSACHSVRAVICRPERRSEDCPPYQCAL